MLTMSYTRKALIISLMTLLSGCSLRYDFAEPECAMDSDCARFEGNGTFFMCEDNACKPSDEIECREDTDCDGNLSCDTQLKCIEFTTIPDMGEDMTDATADMRDMDDMPDLVDMQSVPSCSTNSECITAHGESYICNPDQECVDTVDVNGDCKPIYYSRTSGKDNVVIIGSLLPLIEPFGSILGQPLEQSIQFAIDTINEEGGLAGGRKIAWISCDSKGNASIASRAATHLATTVQTPAIVGPLFSEAFITTVSNVTNAEGVFAISPTATSPSIRNQRQGKNLVWRNIASDEFQAHAISQRVLSLGASKVLVLFKNDKYGRDLNDLIFQNLSTHFGTDELKTVQLPNPIDLEDPSTEGITTDYSTRIAQVIEQGTFEPQAVVIVGTNEGALALSAYLAASQAEGITPPRFLLSHGVVSAMAEIGAQLDAAGLQALIPLIEGISPEIIDLEDTTYQEYARKYSLAFNNVQPALASTTTFDAIMTIAFSMASLQANEPVTGQKVADNIQHLVNTSEGTTINFLETSFFSQGVSILQSGQDINMVGVSGQLDYDLTRGEVYTPVIGLRIVQGDGGIYTIERSREMTFPDAPALTNSTWTEVPAQ